MHFWKYQHELPGICAHTQRNYPRNKQVKSHSRCSATHRCQNDKIFFGHTKDFAIIASILSRFQLQRGPLPPDALSAFKLLRKTLILVPVWAYPRQDRKYALITDASTRSAQQSGGLGTILTQIDEKDNSMPLHLPQDNWRTMKRTTYPFYWKLLQQYGSWKCSTSTWRVKILPYIPTTNL